MAGNVVEVGGRVKRNEWAISSKLARSGQPRRKTRGFAAPGTMPWVAARGRRIAFGHARVNETFIAPSHC